MNIELQECKLAICLTPCECLSSNGAIPPYTAATRTAADLGNDMMRLTAVYDHM
jgi:hypothetical protein